jgi:hypothetical protein
MVIAIMTMLFVAGSTVWFVNKLQLSIDTIKYTRVLFSSVALSLVNYSEFHGRLPYPVIRQHLAGKLTEAGSPNETGRQLFSWRAEIVPYLQSWHGMWDRSLPWDHPMNQHLVELSSFYSYSGPGPKAHEQLFP